jgi:hypothetical protein
MPEHRKGVRYRARGGAAAIPRNEHGLAEPICATNVWQQNRWPSATHHDIIGEMLRNVRSRVCRIGLSKDDQVCVARVEHSDIY